MTSALAPRHLLHQAFGAAIAAAQPGQCLPGYLRKLKPVSKGGRRLVIGAGKAAAAMAQVAEATCSDISDGLVVTRYGHGVPCQKIEVREAAHPVPDMAGTTAATDMLALVRDLRPQDQVICLISGGGSALLTSPAPGLTLADKQAVNAALLKSGAPIAAMNCVRKHLSAIKGGRLAVACHPAAVHSFAISDVPGDDPAVIASGITVADPTTFAEARAILTRYNIVPSPAVAAHLRAAADETPKPGDPRLANTTFTLIATARQSLDAAAAYAKAQGLRPIILGDDIQGEAREVARHHAKLAREMAPGSILLSGGETTVTLRGPGKGGRNAEYLLALGLALQDETEIYALAGDTDGIDGSEDNAGAFWDAGTFMRAKAKGMDPVTVLNNNDAYSLFDAANDLVVTGPTHTNVNDFRAIVKLSAA